MDETVNMKRSVFNYMREKQYYDYMKADNTYHILLKDTQNRGFVNGVSGHNYIQQRINPIGKEHIKKAVCKVVFVSVPIHALDDGNSRGMGYMRCNLARNTVVNGGLSQGYLGGFNLEEVTEQVDVVVPPVTTTAAIINQASAPALTAAANTNTGVVREFDSNGIFGVVANQAAAIPNIQQAQYVTAVAQSTGVKANMFSTPEVLIDNPFGKEITIEALESNFRTSIDMGNSVGEEFALMLEVTLLPNFQENDRLNY